MVTLSLVSDCWQSVSSVISLIPTEISEIHFLMLVYYILYSQHVYGAEF